MGKSIPEDSVLLNELGNAGCMSDEALAVIRYRERIEQAMRHSATREHLATLQRIGDALGMRGKALSGFEADAIAAIEARIAELQTPDAVLAAAEKLLRPSHYDELRVCAIEWSVPLRVELFAANGLEVDGPGLPAAYAKLREALNA
jgi:class 3 adenylate cyclase